ncbi:hypothetical protein Taro_003064 [Colocasia esculenta]|uniref:Uncharacterized protein n=1 Tax=Colocasia esculenta TaxID=4460 RepID=A0A843TKY6_COLES|nr:hypothetical protein [Colocasia esculenta]
MGQQLCGLQVWCWLVSTILWLYCVLVEWQLDLSSVTARLRGSNGVLLSYEMAGGIPLARPPIGEEEDLPNLVVSLPKPPDSILQKATSLAYSKNIFMPVKANLKMEGKVMNVGARTRSKAKGT